MYIFHFNFDSGWLVKIVNKSLDSNKRKKRKKEIFMHHRLDRHDWLRTKLRTKIKGKSF